MFIKILIIVAYFIVIGSLIYVTKKIADIKRCIVNVECLANQVNANASQIRHFSGESNDRYYKIEHHLSRIDYMLSDRERREKKKVEAELEKKNDHVKRVVERVKSVLYPYPPNMWQYVYEERKDRNRHKFTIMCSRDEDIMSAVRNTFYNSDVEWSERRDPWEREWIVYIYDAE